MNAIQEIRAQRKYTQEILARKLGVERSTIAKWETGVSNPRADMLPKLAGLLGCTVDELLREDENSAGHGA